jgi:hypothetical protein
MGKPASIRETNQLHRTINTLRSAAHKHYIQAPKCPTCGWALANAESEACRNNCHLKAQQAAEQAALAADATTIVTEVAAEHPPMRDQLVDGLAQLALELGADPERVSEFRQQYGR